MAWIWIVDGRAAKVLKKLPRETSIRIVKKLDFWIDSGQPLEFAESLTNYELGSYRFRIGDYRVVFDVDGDTITILEIGHRRDIYK